MGAVDNYNNGLRNPNENQSNTPVVLPSRTGTTGTTGTVNTPNSSPNTSTGVGGITSPNIRDDMNFMDDDYKIPGTNTLLNQPENNSVHSQTNNQPTTTYMNYGQRTGGQTVTQNQTIDKDSNTHSETTGGSQSVTNATGEVNANTQANYDKYTGEYIQSQTVTDAYQKLQNLINNKPGEFNSAYTNQLDNLYNQIMQRNPFSYSVKDDALFDIYRQRYEGAGENALKDVQGQYAANTGGYANSAGETAGFAAYQGYLNELQNTIPELYSMAYNRYKDQVDIDFNKYDITKGREDVDYQKYRDQVGDWQTDRDYLQGNYTDERNFDYTQWNDYRDFWQNELWKEKESQWTTDETNWSKTDSHTDEHSSVTDTTETKTWQDPYTDVQYTTSGGAVSGAPNIQNDPGFYNPTSTSNNRYVPNSYGDSESYTGENSYTSNSRDSIWGYDKNGQPITKSGSTSAPTDRVIGYINGKPVYDR